MLYNVKAGIIGLENLGLVYARLIKSHIKNLNLIAAYGRSQKELLFAKNDLSLEYVYSDEKSLIQNHDIDLIFIFSDADRRPHQAIQAIEAGKHVFLANPIALNYEDACAIQKAAKSRPSQVVIVSFSPLLDLVKKDIKSGKIGMINHLSIDSSFMHSVHKEHHKPTGSLFFNHALDEIELCQALLDLPIDNVKVHVQRDTLICNGETKEGSSFTLIVQPQINKGQSYMTIYGNKGQIILNNGNHKSYKLYTDRGLKEEIYVSREERFIYPEYLQLHHFT
ncbi:Gfo/Idh/MocA family oxidoreductase, partial [Saprospiraceae bacterium]|nr:Gfo/Idh/MocA family oxidoreductase [Saprospiraceae bacterium]